MFIGNNVVICLKSTICLFSSVRLFKEALIFLSKFTIFGIVSFSKVFSYSLVQVPNKILHKTTTPSSSSLHFKMPYSNWAFEELNHPHILCSTQLYVNCTCTYEFYSQNILNCLFELTFKWKILKGSKARTSSIPTFYNISTKARKVSAKCMA